MFTFKSRKAAWIAGTAYDPQQGDRCFVYVPDEVWAQPTREDQFPVTLFDGSVTLARWATDVGIPTIESEPDDDGGTKLIPIADAAVALITVS